MIVYKYILDILVLAYIQYIIIESLFIKYNYIDLNMCDKVCNEKSMYRNIPKH